MRSRSSGGSSDGRDDDVELSGLALDDLGPLLGSLSKALVHGDPQFGVALGDPGVGLHQLAVGLHQLAIGLGQYTWSGGETLLQLRSRRDEVLERHEAAMARADRGRTDLPLIEALASAFDEDDDTEPCTVCAL